MKRVVDGVEKSKIIETTLEGLYSMKPFLRIWALWTEVILTKSLTLKSISLSEK